MVDALIRIACGWLASSTLSRKASWGDVHRIEAPAPARG